MNCRKARQQVFEVVDGVADEARRLELESHLAGCPDCERFASELNRSLSFLQRAPRESVDENFEWKLRLRLNRERNRIRDAEVSQRALGRMWTRRYAAAAVGAFAAVFAAGLVAFDTGILTGVRSPRPVVLSSKPSVARGDLAGSGQAPWARGRAENPIPGQRAALPGYNAVSGGTIRGSAGGFLDVIDTPPAPVRLDVDSIIESQLTRMNSAQRARYLQLRIHRLKSRLEQCGLDAP